MAQGLDSSRARGNGRGRFTSEAMLEECPNQRGFMCFFVVAVGLTLRWNTINNIYKCSAAGQLLPVIVGVAGLHRLLSVVLTAVAKGELRVGRWKKVAGSDN